MKYFNGCLWLLNILIVITINLKWKKKLRKLFLCYQKKNYGRLVRIIILIHNVISVILHSNIKSEKICLILIHIIKYIYREGWDKGIEDVDISIMDLMFALSGKHYLQMIPRGNFWGSDFEHQQHFQTTRFQLRTSWLEIFRHCQIMKNVKNSNKI